MTYSVPRNTGQALDQNRANAIETNGLASVLLDHCYRLLLIQEDRIPSVSPMEARSAVASQMESIKDRINALYSILGSADEAIEPAVALKVNVSVFQTYQISKQIDGLIGGGATEEFVLSVAEAFGDIVTRATVRVEGVLGSAADAAQNILGTVGGAADAAKDILGSAGKIGWVIYALAGVLAVGLFYSLKKGVIPK